MDLNQLLFHHQLALIKLDTGEPDTVTSVSTDDAPGSRFDLIRHYETRIDRLRRDMGVSGYPRSA